MMTNPGNLTKAQAELKADTNNAVAYLYPHPVLYAKGSLANTVVTLKDIYATNDAPMAASSIILKGFSPAYDATVVQKLKHAGATIVAKVHGDELALGGTGTYSAYGVIKNPLDQARLIGGSSSGSAATFTVNIGVAIGSDTGDSVRLPASYTGVYGFKPSYGAISRYGLAPFASSLDTVAYFTHNIADVVSVAQVLYGRDPLDMSSRLVTLPTQEKLKPQTVAFLANLDILSETAQAHYLKLATALTKAGINVTWITLDEALLAAIDTTYMSIAFSEASSNTANLGGINFGNTIAGKNWKDTMHQTRSHGFGKMVQRRLALGAFYLLADNQKEIFDKARLVRRKIVDTFNGIYKVADLLVFPAAPVAPLLSEGKASNWYASYLTHANLSGNPSLTIPWIREAKMPIGLALDAPLYADAKLLSYAAYIEPLLEKNHG